MLYRLSYQSESTSRTWSGARASSVCCEKKNKNADTRDRTRDLQIFSLTLSQLSYIGEVLNPYRKKR